MEPFGSNIIYKMMTIIMLLYILVVKNSVVWF